MFEKFAAFFGATPSLTKDITGKPTDRDVQIATGVLLLEMAGADNDYAPEETQAIFEVMQQQYKLEQEQVLELLEAADSLRGDTARSWARDSPWRAREWVALATGLAVGLTAIAAAIAAATWNFIVG